MWCLEMSLMLQGLGSSCGHSFNIWLFQPVTGKALSSNWLLSCQLKESSGFVAPAVPDSCLVCSWQSLCSLSLAGLGYGEQQLLSS